MNEIEMPPKTQTCIKRLTMPKNILRIAVVLLRGFFLKLKSDYFQTVFSTSKLFCLKLFQLLIINKIFYVSDLDPICITFIMNWMCMVAPMISDMARLGKLHVSITVIFTTN